MDRAGDDLAFIMRRDEHGLQRRMLRERRRQPACFGPPIAERHPAQEQDADDAEADSENEHYGEKAPKPAQRHEYRQADELGV